MSAISLERSPCATTKRQSESKSSARTAFWSLPNYDASGDVYKSILWMESHSTRRSPTNMS